MFGVSGSPYLQPGQFLFAANYRYLDSERHFSGTNEQEIREEMGNNVVNEQRLAELGWTYAIDERHSISLGVPYLLYGSWSIPLPLGPPFQPTLEKGPRYKQTSEGLGDITLVGRRWLLAPGENPHGNVALGLGIKFPTGDHDYRQDFPNILGEDLEDKSVDVSIQPGDGGWGAIVDLQAFQTFEWGSLFAAATYLINPRNTNGTLSTRSNLSGQNNVPVDARENSVADQYLFKIGVSTPVTAIEGLAAQLSWRVEGVPATDLIGESDGFRRPGYATFIEPGIAYSRGAGTFTLSVPWALIRNRQDDDAGRSGDATFADWILLLGWQYSF